MLLRDDFIFVNHYAQVSINYNLFQGMLDKVTIAQKANQLLAELRANPDWAIDERNFKQGYFKALEWVLSETGIKQN